MQKQPKVSVVVPIYGVERFLRQCVDSILAQTLKEIEIILVDDGSPDNCGKICDEYAQKDSRIKVIHQPNGGLGNAYNNGIKAANGEYIGLVEPDDWIEPEMYEVMYKNAKHYDTDATKCGFWIYNSTDVSKNYLDPKVPGFACNEPKDYFKIEEYELLCAYHSSIWTYIYKAGFVKNIKFIETKGAGYVDAPFGFEVLCRAKKLSIVPHPFYHWRVENHGNSVSLTDRRALAMADRFIEAKEILKKYGKYDTLREIFYLHAGNANYVHYSRVQLKYRKEYFEKLKYLFDDLKDDKNFSWKYFNNSLIKKWIQNICNNCFWASIFPNIRAVRRFIVDFDIRRDMFCLQLLGFQISYGVLDRPALIKWSK